MYKTKKQKKTQKSKKKTIKLKKKGGSIQIIGKGSFGCAFSKNENSSVITKISLYNESENNEMLFNRELFDLAKETPELRDHLIIILSEPKNVKLSELSNHNNKEMADQCQVFRQSKDTKLLFFDMPNGGKRLDIFLNNMNLKKKELNDLNNQNNHNNQNKMNNNKPKSSLADLKIIIQKALDSLKKLHKLKKYHGDSHLGNFLVEDNDIIQKYKVRLIDFALSGSVNVNPDILSYIQNRIATINPILAGYTFSMKDWTRFFSELSEDTNIEYKLDLMHFLNSLTIIINNLNYKDWVQDPRISKELFFKILHDPLNYTFKTYEATILSGLEELYH